MRGKKRRPFFDSLSNAVAARPIHPQLLGPRDSRHGGFFHQLRRVGESLAGGATAIWNERAESVLWRFATRELTTVFEVEALAWNIEAQQDDRIILFTASGLHAGPEGLVTRTDLPHGWKLVLCAGATLVLTIPETVPPFRCVCSLERVWKARAF